MFHSLFRKKTIESIRNDARQGAENPHTPKLNKVLGVRDLTFFGIAAIIGAGSFSALGSAIATAGPGVVVLYVLCGVACAFTALCYSDFAGRIPVAGSAYTYAYASFGELVAWVIGWALLMEYAIGNVYVAFSWSDYFTSLLSELRVQLPPYLTCSYREAYLSTINKVSTEEARLAWQSAPALWPGGLRVIVDLPALLINAFITGLVLVGIRESRNFSNVIVLLKLAILALVLLVGGAALYKFWLNGGLLFSGAQSVRDFFPTGLDGVMTAVGGVFFAYIGFDAVSVLAEDSKNPQRDLPRGMIFSLVICTALYILLSLVLAGAIDYRKLPGHKDALAFLFGPENLNIGWMHFLVSAGAVIALTSVMLVMQMGPPRIWMNMSRDGLLPPLFRKIHPRFRTPHVSTLLTGLFVGGMIVFTDSNFVLEFTSSGTLFAFVIVCGGVLFLPRREKTEGQFHLPYFNGKYSFPALVAGCFVASVLLGGTYPISKLLFWGLSALLALLAFRKNLSLIPLLGLFTCTYLLTGIKESNWVWFFAWFAIGLAVYFSYGYRHSRLG